MSITVAKWGNSAGIRIPSITLKSAGIALGDLVHAEARPDRTIIIRAVEPVRKRNNVDIHAMLASVTSANLPDVAVFETSPVGAEVW